jgi:hypothetical protein
LYGLVVGGRTITAGCTLLLVRGRQQQIERGRGKEGGTGVAALLELASEPLYILAQAHLHLKLRVWSEAGGTLARGVLTLALLATRAVPPALAISWGQANPNP